MILMKTNRQLAQYFSQQLGYKIDLDIVKNTNQSKSASRQSLTQLLKRNKSGDRTRAKSMIFPMRTLSLCHSDNKGFSAQAIDKKIKGIGIDFEPNHTLNPKHMALYTSKREQRLSKPSSATRLWTVKEAMHKANHQNHKIGWLSAYQLKTPNQWSGRAYLSKPGSHKQYRYSSLNTFGGVLTLAIAI